MSFFNMFKTSNADVKMRLENAGATGIQTNKHWSCIIPNVCMFNGCVNAKPAHSGNIIDCSWVSTSSSICDCIAFVCHFAEMVHAGTGWPVMHMHEFAPWFKRYYEAEMRANRGAKLSAVLCATLPVQWAIRSQDPRVQAETVNFINERADTTADFTRAIQMRDKSMHEMTTASMELSSIAIALTHVLNTYVNRVNELKRTTACVRAWPIGTIVEPDIYDTLKAIDGMKKALDNFNLNGVISNTRDITPDVIVANNAWSDAELQSISDMGALGHALSVGGKTLAIANARIFMPRMHNYLHQSRERHLQLVACSLCKPVQVSASITAAIMRALWKEPGTANQLYNILGPDDSWTGTVTNMVTCADLCVKIGRDGPKTAKETEQHRSCISRIWEAATQPDASLSVILTPEWYTPTQFGIIAWLCDTLFLTNAVPTTDAEWTVITSKINTEFRIDITPAYIAQVWRDMGKLPAIMREPHCAEEMFALCNKVGGCSWSSYRAFTGTTLSDAALRAFYLSAGGKCTATTNTP